MQDGASSHTGIATQAFLQDHCRFIPKNEWLPESADLNPMDYCVWPLLSKKVYESRRTPFTMEELKEKNIK